MNEKMETDVIIVGPAPTGFALRVSLFATALISLFSIKKKHLRFIEKYSEWIDCQNFAIAPHIKEIFGADKSFWRVLLK